MGHEEHVISATAREVWSARRVAQHTFVDAKHLSGKMWIGRYLLARRLHLPTIAPREALGIDFRRFSSPVFLDPTLGGLTAYYEIAHVGVYGPPPAAGETVVDVGANAGMFSAWAGAHVGPGGTVLAMEPHPTTFQMTAKTVAALPSRGVAIQCAAGARPGRMTLTVPGTTTLEATLADTIGGTKIAVDVSTIDIELARHGISSFDLLKIDVEGWEIQALDGAADALRICRRAAVETTPPLRPAVEDRLRTAGMQLREPFEGVWGDPSLCIVRAARLL